MGLVCDRDVVTTCLEQTGSKPHAPHQTKRNCIGALRWGVLQGDWRIIEQIAIPMHPWHPCNEYKKIISQGSVSLPLSPSRTGFSCGTAKLSVELPGLRLHAKPAQRPANKTKAHMLPKIQCLLKLGVEVGNEPNGPGSAVEPCKVYLQAFSRYTGNAVFFHPDRRLGSSWQDLNYSRIRKTCSASFPSKGLDSDKKWVKMQNGLAW